MLDGRVFYLLATVPHPAQLASHDVNEQLEGFSGWLDHGEQVPKEQPQT